jgi:hypothetical protein
MLQYVLVLAQQDIQMSQMYVLQLLIQLITPIQIRQHQQIIQTVQFKKANSSLFQLLLDMLL